VAAILGRFGTMAMLAAILAIISLSIIVGSVATSVLHEERRRPET
jgi:hypothetical protein